MSWLRMGAVWTARLRSWSAAPLVALGLALAGPGLQAHHERIVIRVQPQDQTAAAGQSATFSVQAAARGPRLRYQWFRRPGRHREPDRIPGATAPSYTTAPLRPDQDGWEYMVLLRSGRARAQSRAARLTVTPAPVPPPPVPPTTPAPVQPVVALAPQVSAGAANLAIRTQDQGAGMTYAWTLANGTLTSGQGTPAITFSTASHGLWRRSILRLG